MYKQSIIFFGIVLPLLGIIALVGGVYVLKTQMTESFEAKTAQYKIFRQSQNAAMGIEGKIIKQRQSLERWKKDLSAETISTVRSNLKLIGDQLPSKEFQETSFDPLNGKGGFGSATAQKSSQLHMGFRGTYRSAERAFLELETRMPQLQCQELKIEPTGQSALLNFQVTYTAWEN